MTDMPDDRGMTGDDGWSLPATKELFASAPGRAARAGPICLAGLGLVALASLGAARPELPAQYIWPLFLLVAVTCFAIMEDGLVRVFSLRFPAVVVLSVACGVALPHLAWPAPAVEALGGGLTRSAVMAGLLAPATAAAAHLAARLFDRAEGHTSARLISARPPPVLAVFGLILAGGLFLLAYPGSDTPANRDTLPLIGYAMAGAAAGLLLLGQTDRIGRSARLQKGVFLLPLLVVLAASVGAAVHVFLPSISDGAALTALAAVVVLFLAIRAPVAALAGMAVLIVLMPLLPTVLGLAYAPGAGQVAGLLPPLMAMVLAAVVVADRHTDFMGRVLAQGRRLDRLRSKLEHHGAGRLLYVDLGQKKISLHELTTGRRPTVPFSRFFRHARSSEILDLLDALRAAQEPDPERAFPLHMSPDPFAGGRGDQAPIRLAELHVLERSETHAWLGLVDVSLRTELEQRAETAEQALGETLVREERLLSVAAHELRTPLSVLSMLSEELEAGTPWDEIAPNFRKSLGGMTSLLDDLRVRDSKDAVQLMQTTFTLREMALHLQEIYTAAAQANGIALMLGMSQQADTLIVSDYGRVFIALSKLIHNAIIHSRGSEITLSVFLTRQSDGKAIATWQVSDNGRGIPSERCETVFRPFDTDGFGQDGERPGLGLYTARKAVQAMGGNLDLRRNAEIGAPPRHLPAFSTARGGPEISVANPQSGATFVLKHPARLAERSKRETLEQLPVTEMDARYSDKAVLLVEDNQIVGEITVARLRRLFGKTIWSQDGEDALIAYESNKPDLMLVDQLLPGMLGAEVVKHVREIDRHLPIVGITASTLGSECAELEAAGANYALEKPLSVQQLQKIASEFFGAGTAEG